MDILLALAAIAVAVAVTAMLLVRRPRLRGVRGARHRIRRPPRLHALNPWSVAMFRTMKTIEPATAAERSAYDRWLDQTSTREEARNDRVHAAEGVIPTPLWRVLFFSGGLIVLYMLFFADSGERAVVQAMLIGSVVAVMVATMLLLHILDRPYLGELRPVAMERTLGLIEQARTVLGEDGPLPCHPEGRPR